MISSQSKWHVVSRQAKGSNMAAAERYTNYDPFARVYQRHWSQEAPQQILTVMDKLLLPRLPRGARILDVCCGTGYLAAELNERGFAVTGLDGSKEMLRYARRAAPASRFILADARRFNLPPVHQGAISIFDSLNHVMTLAELRDVLRNVQRALAPSGYFFFDMNMEEGYIENWVEHFSIVEEDQACILRGAYDEEQKIARYEITMFERNRNGWKRTETTIAERCYSRKEIKDALKGAGFEAIETHDAVKLGLADHVGRKFFLARKKG